RRPATRGASSCGNCLSSSSDVRRARPSRRSLRLRELPLSPLGRGTGGRGEEEVELMKILVPVKRVAALEDDFRIRDDGRDVDPEDLNHDLNEWDNFSLEQAVLIKEAASSQVQVIAVTVGPEECDQELRACL